MGALDTIINVQISKQTSAVSQVGFGTPLILGSTSPGISPDLIRIYTDLDGVAADFATTDPEYIHAAEAFEQELTPTQVAIGRRLALVTQIDTVSVPTVADSTVYTLTLNGLIATFTSGIGATATSILTGLKAAILALSPAQPVTVGTPGSTVTVTANVPGNGFSLVATTANLAVAASTPNHGVIEDIQNIQDVNDDWYGLDICSLGVDDIKNAASYIETQEKIFISQGLDPQVLAASSSSDILSYLKSKGYNRTAFIWSSDAANGPAAAWLGGELPKVPGSSTYKFKQLVGITPDKFTATQKNVILGTPGNPGKNGNIYETIAGVNITEEGWMVSGQFIDITVGIDWIKSRLQEQIFTQLVNNSKIPFTDQGIAIVENEMRSVFEQGVANGLIAPGEYTITVPKALDVPFADRANRVLPNVTFTLRLAGALHFVQIKGIVTV